MNKKLQEEAVDKGFSSIYEEYEVLSNENYIDQTMRKQVYFHIEKIIIQEAKILEINAGSGIDAVYFAKKGFDILATDIAIGSEKYILNKKKEFNYSNLKFKLVSYLNLHELHPNKYDFIFSNFGGLNCTDKLEQVMDSFYEILNENGKVTLVILNKYYLWDWINIFKLKFSKAFYRMSKKPIFANIKDEKIQVYYYSTRQLKALLSQKYELIKIENLGNFYPNTNHKILTKISFLIPLFIKIDRFFVKNNLLPFHLGDYFIISFQKH
jgi:ubiquinone/menaquinone biosynthesis C-methylase UbiE